jgi:hypothetical protein
MLEAGKKSRPCSRFRYLGKHNSGKWMALSEKGHDPASPTPRNELID